MIIYANNSNILSLIGEIDRFNGMFKSGMFTSQGDKGTPVIVTNMWLYTEIVASQ